MGIAKNLQAIYSGFVKEPEVDYSTIPFFVKNDSSVSGNLAIVGYLAQNGEIFMSRDNENWTSLGEVAVVSKTITFQPNETIYFRASGNLMSGGSTAKYTSIYSSDFEYSIGGNIMSLLYGSDFIGQDSITVSFTFYRTFYNSPNLKSAEKLVMPATNLVNGCYAQTFMDSTGLVKPPKELPATVLVQSAYYGMFSGCTSLTESPEIKAISYYTNAMNEMFNNCTSLSRIECMLVATSSITSFTANVSPTGTFVKSDFLVVDWSVDSNGIPSGWVVQEKEADYKSIPFYIKKESGDGWNITFKKSNDNVGNVNLKGSFDLITWYSMGSPTTEGNVISLESNRRALFLKGINDTWGGPSQYIGNTITVDVPNSVGGNIMSLILDSNGVQRSELPETSYTFQALFNGNTTLVSAEHLMLPDNTTTGCYLALFSNCSSLIKAPVFPANVLSASCYYYCFLNCTSLQTAPQLPAKTLADSCYSTMFRGCTNLTTAPELPATTLVNNCYNSMFNNCVSLTTAPELPATTLAQYCYNSLFNGCTSLNYIKAMFTTTPSAVYSQNWVNNVAATGTFVKNASATWSVTGTSGIPSGWTVETAAS